MATEMVLIPKSTYDAWKKSSTNDGNKEEAATRRLKSNDSDPVISVEEEVIDNLKKLPENNIPNNIDKLLPQNKGSENIDADMLDEFPLNYRLYAQRLLQYIKKSGTDVITWKNDDATLIYRGTPQVGSNIIELVNYIFKTNSRKPKGLEVFNIGLKEIKTPKAYLKPYLLRPPGIPKSIKKKWVKY